MTRFRARLDSFAFSGSLAAAASPALESWCLLVSAGVCTCLNVGMFSGFQSFSLPVETVGAERWGWTVKWGDAIKHGSWSGTADSGDQRVRQTGKSRLTCCAALAASSPKRRAGSFRVRTDDDDLGLRNCWVCVKGLKEWLLRVTSSVFAANTQHSVENPKRIFFSEI